MPPAPDTVEVERKKAELEAKRITTYRNEVDDLYDRVRDAIFLLGFGRADRITDATRV